MRTLSLIEEIGFTHTRVERADSVNRQVRP